MNITPLKNGSVLMCKWIFGLRLRVELFINSKRRQCHSIDTVLKAIQRKSVALIFQNLYILPLLEG